MTVTAHTRLTPTEKLQQTIDELNKEVEYLKAAVAESDRLKEVSWLRANDAGKEVRKLQSKVDLRNRTLSGMITFVGDELIGDF